MIWLKEDPLETLPCVPFIWSHSGYLANGEERHRDNLHGKFTDDDDSISSSSELASFP